MTHNLNIGAGHRPPAFLNTPDLGSLLRKSGVDTRPLRSEQEIRAAISGLSADARDKILSALKTKAAGRDVDQLCGFDDCAVSER